MTTTREKLIATTSELIEAQGYHATGLNQIIKESGAPKGSLYYHFPGGKEELTSIAMESSGANIAGLIGFNFSSELPLGRAVRDFLAIVAKSVEKSGFSSGSPLTAVAIETANSSKRINLACCEAFTRIQAAFQAKLTAARLPEERAAELAAFITAAIEGGIILSRTYHSVEPLQQVADQLGCMLDEVAAKEIHNE
jgi:TetR/AcrR family transcriptional repressor of lmrAB and yxaGH operons